MMIIDDYYIIPTTYELKYRAYFTNNIIINNSFLSKKDKLKKVNINIKKKWWYSNYVYNKYITKSMEWWKRDYLINKYKLD